MREERAEANGGWEKRVTGREKMEGIVGAVWKALAARVVEEFPGLRSRSTNICMRVMNPGATAGVGRWDRTRHPGGDEETVEERTRTELISAPTRRDNLSRVWSVVNRPLGPTPLSNPFLFSLLRHSVWTTSLFVRLVPLIYLPPSFPPAVCLSPPCRERPICSAVRHPLAAT